MTRVKRTVMRALRVLLRRCAAARPRPDDLPGADKRVFILLVSAWGMGGTIRAALNLAGHLAENGYEVEILSGFRRREAASMGELPAGVKVIALDDQRKERQARGPAGLLQRALRKRDSVLTHSRDARADELSLWSDIQLVRRLRRRSGFLVATRPSFNLMAAQLPFPGLVTVGLEQMHLHTHSRKLKQAMRRDYPRLDALAVLTERDLEAYTELLDGSAPRLVRIPNTVRAIAGPKADADAKVLLAAGRLTRQKGFDLLIPAYAPVAAAHPDWELRIFGRGKDQKLLQGLIAEHGLEDTVKLLPASDDLPGEMARASTYVLSSRFEGFPLVLVEAMAKGMAIVSFDCPTGPADIIDDHRNGLIVPAQDTAALTAAMLEIIADDDLRRRCGEAAVATAADYTMAAIGPRWEALFHELWAARSAAA
jgi:glycosyltransferase involved in cell wall biosynthesis